MHQGKSPYIGLLSNPDDQEKAIQQIIEGEPLVMQLGGVYGLFADASNKRSIERIFEIKGENKRSLTIIKRTDDIIKLANYAIIRNDLRNKLSEIGKNLGLVAHLRFPINKSLLNQLPEYTYSYHLDELTGISYPVVQYLDPSSHTFMSSLVDSLEQKGIQNIAVTSLNNHAIGESEITEKIRAISFSKEKKLPLIIEDPLHRRKDIKGSYAIIFCFSDSFRLVRHGAIDTKIINAILENRLQIKNTNKFSTEVNSHNFNDFISLIETHLITGEKAKMALLLYMSGENPDNILKKLD